MEKTPPLQREEFLRKAHALSPENSEITLAYAKHLFQQAKPEKARVCIEQTWSLTPSPLLVDAYLQFGPPETPFQRVETCKSYLEKCESHPFNHLLLGRVSLAADLWVSARDEFEALAQTHPHLAYPLLARLEQQHHQDLNKANHWLEKALALSS